MQSKCKVLILIYGVNALGIIRQNLIKNSDSSNSQNGLVGGRNQEWKTIIEKICQKYVEHKNLCDVDMGELRHVISKINRFDCPIKLTPKDSTFLDVAIWAYFQKRLSNPQQCPK